MFPKKNIYGKIKGRGCAYGRKKRFYNTKEETTFSTVSTKYLLLSCIIDSKESRDVEICDIPGSFLQADMDELIHLRVTFPLTILLNKLYAKIYEK